MSTNKKKKDNNLSIVITEPTIEKNENKKKRKGQRRSKQMLLRQKHQIEQMQSEVRKLDEKIESERDLLKNKILLQQLQLELKKNQIASKMSKKEIIMRRLEVLKDSKQKLTLPNNNKNRNLIHINNQQVSKPQFRTPEKRQKLKPNQQSNFQNSKVRKSIIQEQKQERRKHALKIQRLRQIWEKQKQYGNRVQKQYCQNRAKSAFSYLQFKKLQQLQRSEKLQQRNRILSQIKKPPLPITINAQLGRRQQIDKIYSSKNSSQQKLLMLNYLSQVELNRVNLKQIKGKQQNLQTLNYINRARTEIMLNRR